MGGGLWAGQRRGCGYSTSWGGAWVVGLSRGRGLTGGEWGVAYPAGVGPEACPTRGVMGVVR